MAEISQDEMAEMQSQAGKGDSGGATKIAQDVAQGLVKLQEMLGKSPGATDEDIAQMDDILMKFADLVEKKLGGSAPGENQPDDSEQMQQVSADAGPGGMPMGPQMKN